MQFETGRDAGTAFEELFERQCKLEGLWPDPNLIKARRAWKGRLQALPSNLDYTLMGRGGRIGFFDCKTFDKPYFTYSDLSKGDREHQIELAARYNEWGFHAGFVVWFRPINRVVFYPGWLIAARGERTRFLPTDGAEIGTWSRFDPLRLFLNSPMGSPSGILR